MDLKPRKIDLYIFKRFITTFFIALLLIIFIVIVFDVSEKIDDFVANKAPLKAIIFDYYLNFAPYFANMFSPLFVFITVIFFTSRMAANSEIIAILSCGISYKRMMVPYLVSALLIFGVSLSLNLWVIPRSNATRVKFEQKYIKAKNLNMQDVHYQIAPGEFVYVENFSTWNNTAYRFTLESIDHNNLVSKLSAESAEWDSLKQCWKLRRYVLRDYSEGLSDRVKTGAQLDTAIALNVKDFHMNKRTIEALTYGQLHELIQTQKMRGDSNVMYSQIEMYNRFAMPFSVFILTIMGVSLTSRKKRGSIGWNLGIGIGLSFLYILFQRFSQMFVYTDTLPPAIAIWMPNVIYALIAVFLYSRARR